MNHVFMEQLWRIIPFEHVHLKPSSDGIECYQKLEEYVKFYKHQIRQQSLPEDFPIKNDQHHHRVYIAKV
ncbi:MAG: hypothetical protein OXE55_01385 [Flavobacteriaceae bacterium]|nr:hypothetical protein [Flavobacteriaceae bacterium]